MQAPEVQAAMSEQRFEDVAPLLDARALQADSTDYLADWPVALHVLGHIYNDQLEDARFLYKQAPRPVQEGQEVATSFRVLQALWNNDYQGMWETLLGQSWTGDVQILVDALASKLRERYFVLIARAYSKISTTKAAAFMGLSVPDVLTLAASKGWVADDSCQMLMVKPYEAPPSERTNLKHLERLTGYAVHLGNS